MRVLLADKLGWRFPFSRGEAAEDEVSRRLHDGQSPSLLVAAPMEVRCLPFIRASIINPLESSLRKLIPYKLHDHPPMSWGHKGLWCPKIFFGIILLALGLWFDSLRNRQFLNSLNSCFWLWIFNLFLSLSKVSLRFTKFPREQNFILLNGEYFPFQFLY